MATRPIVLSNGELHVGLNTYGLVHDFYFPYVGLENHAADGSLRHHIGVFLEGAIHWLDSGEWEISQSYPEDALVGRTVARHAGLQLRVELEDAVDAESNVLLRYVHVVNETDRPREARIYFHQAFIIGDSASHTDTAQYLPDNDAILHYRGRRAFIVSGEVDGKPLSQYTVGLFGGHGHEGTYRDAEDGQLSQNNVEHGRVDSTIGFDIPLEAQQQRTVSYWIAAGTSTREALAVHKSITAHGVAERISKTKLWWNDWLAPALRVADKIEPAYRKLFILSVMVVKSHTDKRGAVIASTDSSLLKQARDAYAYCWPRDGAYALWPLIRMGYTEEPRKFFDFCRRNLHPTGYLMHKYRADGALGSSWHPYIHSDDQNAPPIQEDETALTLFVFAQFYHTREDKVLLHDFYEPMVLPMANFMANYIDHRTGLPKPTYDLWEERYLTSTYTTAVTYAALLAAAEIAEIMGDSAHAVTWRAVADDMAIAVRKLLYRPNEQTFYKGLLVKSDNSIEYATDVDSSSTFGAFMYGLFSPQSDEIQTAIKTLEQRVRPAGKIGFSRYENDSYMRLPGNPESNQWIITSLWMAQYYIEQDRMDDAHKILDWVKSNALSTGMLSEQIDPDGKHASVLPLVWSHAEFVSTMLDSISEGS